MDRNKSCVVIHPFKVRIRLTCRKCGNALSMRPTGLFLATQSPGALLRCPAGCTWALENDDQLRLHSLADGLCERGRPMPSCDVTP
jgi:hypothetical protein